MIPAFVVRSVDGEVRAYTEAGVREEMPREVVEAWCASGKVQVITMRPEPSQVEGCRRAEAARKGVSYEPVTP